MQTFEKFMSGEAIDAPSRLTPALAALFDAGGAAMALIDLKAGRFDLVNPRCRELLGLDAGRSGGPRPADLASDAGLAGVLDALRGAGRWEGEWTFRRGEGARLWLQTAVCVWRRDESGEPTHAVAVMLDVSEHKRSLERLHATEDLLLQCQTAGGVAIFSRDLRPDGPSPDLSAGEPGIIFSDALGFVFHEDAPRLRQSISETLARR